MADGPCVAKCDPVDGVAVARAQASLNHAQQAYSGVSVSDER